MAIEPKARLLDKHRAFGHGCLKMTTYALLIALATYEPQGVYLDLTFDEPDCHDVGMAFVFRFA